MKRYGKFDEGQFVDFVDYLRQLFELLDFADRAIAATPKDRLDRLLTDDFACYYMVYELPLVEQVSIAMRALNRGDDLAHISASPDPGAAVLSSIRQGFVEEQEHPSNPEFTDAELFGLVYALTRNVLSIKAYGKSISGLLTEARDSGCDLALFRALRMDRSVIGCTTAMRFIAKAQVMGDVRFFSKLRATMRGPDHRRQPGLDYLRYVMVLLREMDVTAISEAELEELVVDKLKLYPKHQPNARRAIRKHYQAAMKQSTT